MSIFFSTIALGNQNNDLKEMNLKGRVKAIKQFAYRGDDVKGQIVKGGRQCYREKIYLFNEAGQKIETYNFEGTFGYDSCTISKEIYHYDKDGNRIQIEIFNSDGSIRKKWIYKYEDGNNVETTAYHYKENRGVKWTSQYDSYGNEIEINCFYEDGTREKDYNKFDSKGHLIESEYYEQDTLWAKEIFKYDFKGNLIEEYRYNSNGELDWMYKYDKNSNEIKVEDYYGDKKLHKVFIYKYAFDEQGNWVNRITTESTPIGSRSSIDLYYITEREIEYLK